MFTKELIEYFKINFWENKAISNWDFMIIFDFWIDFYYQNIFDENKNIKKIEILSRIVKNSDNFSIDLFFKELVLNKKETLFDIFILEKLFQSNILQNTWVPFSINLFANSLNDKKILEILNNFEEKYPNFTKLCCIEILETEYNYSEIKENISILKQKWYTFALDDVFSWYHSLDFIQNNDLSLIDIIKIDGKALLNHFNTDKNILENNLKTFVNTYKKNYPNTTFVFEFIEDNNYFEFAKNIWSNLFQWYFLEKPVKF